jgi:hypothetical protein
MASGIKPDCPCLAAETLHAATHEQCDGTRDSEEFLYVDVRRRNNKKQEVSINDCMTTNAHAGE